MTSTARLIAVAAESLSLALAADPADPARVAAVCRLIGELGERLTQEKIREDRAADGAA